MTAELYINGTPVELDQKNVIALSFAVNTLNELKSLNGNISNRITLSLTASNLKALGFVGDTNIVLTETIRKQNIARYVQNGVEVIPEGKVNVGTVNQKGIGIVVTSGNVDFFDAIAGYKKSSIRDLDFSEYNHIYGFDIIESRLNREGYIYPVINYGDMTDATAFMNIATMRPAMFVKTIVQKIVKEAGFDLVNLLETDPRTADQYARMIVPFTNDEFLHGQRFIDANKGFEFRVSQTAGRQYTFAGDAIEQFWALIKYNTVVKDPSNSFVSGGIYRAPGKFIADIVVTMPSITFDRTNVNAPRYYQLQLVKKTEFGTVTVLQEINLAAEAGSAPATVYQNIVLKAEGVKIKESGVNEDYYVRVSLLRSDGPEGQPDIIMTVNKPIVFSVTSVGGKVLLGENVELEATLPDISKKDFLKAVANFFGGIVQTDNQNKILQIVPFFKIVDNIENRVDWSDRIVNPDAETNEVQIGDYGQSNVALYKNDNAITPDDYGSGSFVIADENLDLSKDLFELPFSASFDSFVSGGLSAVLINKIETEGGNEFTQSTDPRIVMVDFVNTEVSYRLNGSDDFTNTQYDSIPRTYFAGDGIQHGLLLQEILDRYYPEIITMLNDQRKKVLKLFLREPDIAGLDFFKPVFLKQYSSYFYISKITDYVGERPCTVELIKLF